MTTEKLNVLAHEFIISNGATPTPLGYMGYPKSICTSVNEVICHGIPSSQVVLQDGDIINIDISLSLDGYVGDSSKTFFVGNSIPAKRKLVTEVAAESLALAISVVKHGARIGDIGAIIQQHAEQNGCSVVRDFTGHGVGKTMHEPPEVPHFGLRGEGAKIVRGMTFTIEPMINAGTWQRKILADGWTSVTVDGQPSAQFEHTLAVVRDGVEVLTALPDDTIVKRARELGAIIYDSTMCH